MTVDPTASMPLPTCVVHRSRDVNDKNAEFRNPERISRGAAMPACKEGWYRNWTEMLSSAARCAASDRRGAALSHIGNGP